MSFKSLIYSASTNKELVTFIAYLGDANTKEHFVIIRGNGELIEYDSASEFVFDTYFFANRGYAFTSMSLDGESYCFPDGTMKTILGSLLRRVENPQG